MLNHDYSIAPTSVHASPRLINVWKKMTEIIIAVLYSGSARMPFITTASATIKCVNLVNYDIANGLPHVVIVFTHNLHIVNTLPDEKIRP